MNWKWRRNVRVWRIQALFGGALHSVHADNLVWKKLQYNILDYSNFRSILAPLHKHKYFKNKKSRWQVLVMKATYQACWGWLLWTMNHVSKITSCFNSTSWASSSINCMHTFYAWWSLWQVMRCTEWQVFTQSQIGLFKLSKFRQSGNTVYITFLVVT